MSYYFISVGGSGAKVMESLVHLTVAGLMPNKVRDEKLYLLSVDPDTGNGNLARSMAALQAYNEFQKLPIGSDTSLFKTEVHIFQPFPWNPASENNKISDLDYIVGRNSLGNSPVGKLYDALYTKEERKQALDEGFRGRPSIGAAVMARKIGISSERPWKDFIEKVKSDATRDTVKIFLAGSVFGGTGASGMPTIARLLAYDDELKDYVKSGKILIGGAFILPYFTFTAEESKAKGIYASSDNFLMNTKAALKYYAEHDNSYKSMYLIGDYKNTEVKNFEVGARGQRNDAHIVDLYGAFAARDFFAKNPDDLEPYYYIAHANENVFNWADLPKISTEADKDFNKELLAQFTRFIFFYLREIEPNIHKLADGDLNDYDFTWYVDYLENVSVNSDSRVNEFEKYAKSYALYLSQLETLDGGRSVNFVDTNSFKVNAGENTEVNIEKSKFKTMIDDESDIDIKEIKLRLAERANKEVPHSEGFGKFLRKLYDACGSGEVE